MMKNSKLKFSEYVKFYMQNISMSKSFGIFFLIVRVWRRGINHTLIQIVLVSYSWQQRALWDVFTYFVYLGIFNTERYYAYCTDKRTDVWSRYFITWKINSGLWAVVWAGLWKKRVWADYEQLLRPVFSLFRGQKNILIFFCPWKIEKKTQKSWS